MKAIKEILEPNFRMYTDTVQEAIEIVNKAENLILNEPNNVKRPDLLYWYVKADVNNKYVGHLKQLIENSAN
jgi:hypothetical protein